MLTREVQQPPASPVWFHLALGFVSGGLALGFVSLMALAIAGCAEIKEVGGEIGGHVAEWIACPTDLIDCGHVYLFEVEADNPLGHVELCVDDDDDPDALSAAESVYGVSEPTPRHEGLCLFCCGPDCGRGGNAYSGTWGCP